MWLLVAVFQLEVLWIDLRFELWMDSYSLLIIGTLLIITYS